ncbi:unnamed protein product [Amoebophrya sp. A25]|nr:unnamed protein product [Amoebophrya sp. A25]|eukprot:GSA25T00011550001.1
MSSSSAIKVDTTLSGAGGMTGTAGTDPVRQGIAAPVAKLASMPVQHNNIDRKSKLQLQMLRRKQVSSAKTSARRQSYDHDSETTSGGNGVSRYNCSFHVDFNDAHDVVLGPHESREKHQEDEDALSVSTIDDSDASYLDGRHDHKSAQLRDALPAPSSRADRGLEDVVHGSSISNISTKQEARSTGPSTMTSATAAPKPFDADVLRKERRDAAGFSVPWVNLLPPAGPDKSLELSTLEQHYSLQVLAHRCPILMAIVRHFVSGEVHLQKGEVVHTSSCEHQNYEIAGGGKYADTGNLRKNNAGAKSGRVVPEHQQHNRKVNNASGGILDNRGREEQIKIDNKNQERMVLMKRSIVFDSPLFRVWRGTVDRALQDRMAFGNIFGASIPPFYFWHVGNVRSLPISGKWICSSTVLEGASAGAAAASAMGLLTLPKKESFACDNQSVARLGHSGFSNATLRGVGEDSLEHGLFLLLDGGVDEYNTYAREADSLYGANNSSASGGGTYGDVARAGLRGELELLMPGNIAHQQEKASQQHKTIENLAGRILYTQQQFRETRRRRVITCNTNLRSDAFFRLERLKQRLGSEKQRIQELQYELDRVENLESSYTSRRPPHAARIDHQVVVDHVHDEDEHEESSSDQLSESSSSSDSTVFSHSPHSTSTVSMNDDFEDREEREIRKHEDKNKSCCSEHEKYRQEKSSTSPSSGPLLNIISMSTSTATTSYMLSSSMQGLEKQDQDGSYVQEIRDLLFQVGHWEQCEGQTRELIHGAEHRLLQQEARFRDRLRERDAYYALLEQHWRAQLEQLLKEQLLAEREEMLSLCHQQLGIVVPEEDKLNFYGGSVRGINEERAAFRCHLRDREQYLLVVEKRKLLEAVHDTVDQLSEDYRTHAECLDEKKAELEQLQNYMRKLRERHDLINECVALEQKDYTASGGSDRIVMDVEA